MAGRWRIRHKLILGLGLVVGVLALLLAGTLKGLASYRTTTTSMDSKLVELRAAQDLKVAVTNLAALAADRRKLFDNTMLLRERLDEARQFLAEYEEKLRFTLEHRRDSDKGREEQQQVDALERLFDKLGQTLDEIGNTTVEIRPGDRNESEHQKRIDNIYETLIQLVKTSDDLQDAIYGDLHHRITRAKTAYRNTMWAVLSTSVVGVALMVGLLRFFYGWVFYPIRDLELGVGRVAHGDFEHRIELHSGDEIEDLAAAFNDMAGRLRELYSNLIQQVNERSRQLVRSERLASVGFLAAGVAHEINNPLASIAFCAEALEARLREKAAGGRRPAEAGGRPPAEEEVVTKYLRMIQEEAFRCKKITERLLEFSRPGERRREAADLGEIVQSVIDMLQHHQSCKGKQVLLLQPPSRVVAWVNVQEIKSVVLNLVVNALDSMDGTEGGTVTVRLRQRDSMAEMEFTDTGCGMTPEVLENIFEPFFTRSRTGKGTGLGLTICHRIVAQHGGEIEAASPGPGKGSTFTVRMPVDSEPRSMLSYQPAGPLAEAA